MNFDPEAVREFERDGWNRAAASYESSFATATRQFIPALLDAVGAQAGTPLLDVACGPGFVTVAAVERGAKAQGLDFSSAMLSVARARHPGIVFDEGDAEALPYEDATFMGVVSNFGVHHVPRPILAVRQAHRVLRKGGRLAFTIWSEPRENIAWKLVFDAVARWGDMGASNAPPPGGGFGTAQSCVDAMREAGFTDVTTTLLRGVWRHADAAAMVAALRAGTARMAALIASQSETAMPAIIADITAGAERYRDRDGLAVPIAAVVASGVKT